MEKKMDELTLRDLITLCDKKMPTETMMTEISQKVDEVLKEFKGYQETLKYWQEINNKRVQLSN